MILNLCGGAQVCAHLQAATVTLLPLLPEAVATDGGGLQAAVVGGVQQACGAALQQELLVVVGAAAAEGARDVPAEDTRPIRSQLAGGGGASPAAASPERGGHDAAVPGAGAGAGVVVVHAQVVAHLVGQRGPDGDGAVVVVLEDGSC